MDSVNYQKELEKKLDTIVKSVESGASVPTLLLHSCCAPCSSYCISYLSNYFKITVFYYNPNITERDEYMRRAEEQKRFISEYKTKYPVSFIDGGYDDKMFFEAVRGMEKCPEGGDRCEVCFRMRLKEAASLAKELNMDYFTTTLTISPMKNTKLLNQIGEEEAAKAGSVFLNSDFKKKNGFKCSTELSKEYNLYRQDYCGCVFSKAESELRRESMNSK